MLLLCRLGAPRACDETSSRVGGRLERVESGRGGSPKRCAEAEDLRRDGLIFVGPLGRFPRACSLGARPTRAAVWFFSQSVRRRVFLFIAYDTGRHGFGACAVRRRSRRRRGRLQTATARRELLDSGADGSPKSWRALADDLRRDGLILGLIRHARPLDALPLHAAVTSFSLAELLGRVEALIVLSSPRVLREGAGTKTRRPHQVEIEGGDSL